MRFPLYPTIAVVTTGKFLGTDENVKGQIIALEFYKGSVPTFTFLSDTGHLFAYLPPNAFTSEAVSIDGLVDVECPGVPPSVCCLDISKGGFGKVNQQIIPWESYICSIDWDAENILIHCVRLKNGAFAFLRNSRFQIGGNSWNPPQWRKLREEWKLK